MLESSDNTEEPPPNNNLESILERIKPVVRVEQTPDNPDGKLFFVEKRNPYTDSFLYEPELKDEATNLVYLDDINFFHTYEKENVFKPSLAEIARSIPKEYYGKNICVEAIIEMSAIKRVNGYYRGLARLYEINES